MSAVSSPDQSSKNMDPYYDQRLRALEQDTALLEEKINQLTQTITNTNEKTETLVKRAKSLNSIANVAIGLAASLATIAFYQTAVYFLNRK